MRVLVTADWHLDLIQYGILDSNGRNSRLIDIEDVIGRVIDFAIDQKIDLFVQCGDIFHTNKPAQEAQLIFFRILNRLASCDFQSRFIIGNHDYSSKIGSMHALALFQSILDGNDKIKIYDETTWELHAVEDDKLLVCYHPFRSEKPDWSRMAEFGSVNSTAIVCHSHLEGAVVGAEPFEIPDDNVTKFNQLPVDHVWAGHFHKPQILCERPLAFYPGSIQPVDFSERLDVKGVVVVNTLNRSYECAGFETRKLIQIDLENRFVLNDEEINQCSNAIVKVNARLDEAEVHKFDESLIRKRLVEANVHSIASINLTVVKQDVKRDKSINLDTDMSENFAKYVRTIDYGEQLADVERIGLEIIKQCTS